MTKEKQSVREKLCEWLDLNQPHRFWTPEETRRYWELKAEVNSEIVPALIEVLKLIEDYSSLDFQGHIITTSMGGKIWLAKELLTRLGDTNESNK